MKVFINRTIVQGPYGGGNLFVKAFYEHVSEFGLQLTHNPKQADVVFIAGMSAENGSPSAFDLLWHPKKIFRVNECDSRKNTVGVDDTIKQISVNCQKTVYVSNWLRDELKADNDCPVIYNGCDDKIFKPQPKLNNGKINIVTHHWSDNTRKGLETYQWLDEFAGNNIDFSFTYIGRIKTFLRNSTKIDPIFGHILGTTLGKFDVSVNASVYDPGPNSVLEPLSCNIPTFVHKDGGGGVEFAGQDHTFSNHDELEKILLSKNYVMNSFKPSSWHACIEQYIEVIKSM